MISTPKSIMATESRGKGEAIVFVHGLGSTSSVWEAQVRHFSSQFKTIRYDLDGSGRSSPSGELSIQGWVDDLANLVGIYEIKRAHFVGHSLGTLILQHFAVQSPSYVESLCLLGTNRSPNEQRRKALADRIEKVSSQGLSSIVDAVIDGTLSPAALKKKPELAGYVRELLLCQSDGGYLASLRAVMAATAADAKQITCPVLAVCGDDDKVSPQAIADDFIAELPRGVTLMLGECGHWHPIEQPAAVNAAIEKLLNS
ncbi:MAG: alpha/beta fold hydrolase [Xanthobacteraceae bacterium]|nr:alpha/beta fold hydrolase [Xanthobacteraceae bacterium]